MEPYLAVDTSLSSQYSSRGGLAWTPPASGEGSTPTWTEGTPSFTDSSSSGDFGINKIKISNVFFFLFYLNKILLQIIFRPYADLNSIDIRQPLKMPSVHSLQKW